MTKTILSVNKISWAKIITPLLSLIFLLHIFSIEKHNSGFIDYEKPFLLMVTCFLFLALIYFVLKNRSLVFCISKTALYLIGFLTYLSIQFYTNDQANKHIVILLWCIPFIYLAFQNTFLITSETYILSFLIANVIISILYIFNIHIFDFLSYRRLNASINTGANANYFACIIPFTIGIWTSCPTFKSKTPIKILCTILSLLCIIIIVKSQARLAYVSIVVSCTYFTYHTLLTPANRIRLNKVWIWALLLLLAVIILYALFKINTQSVMGRFLIYKVSMNIFFENLVWGCGPGNFGAVYNNFQAEYFKVNDVPMHLQLVAGDTFQSFNEILRVLVELGIIGSVILGILLYNLIRIIFKQTQFHNLQYGAVAALISIAISSLLSYPFTLWSITINMVFFIAILTVNEKERITLNIQNIYPIRLLVATLVLIGMFFLLEKEYKRLNSYQKWERASLLSLEGEIEKADILYRSAYPYLKDNGKFLVNYGTELLIAGRNDLGIHILEKAKNMNPSTVLYLYLGDGYFAAGDLLKSQSAYQTAINIAPGRFLGRHKLLLLQLYAKDTISAQKTARTIIQYPVKIPSQTVSEIKEYSRTIIQSQK